MAKFPITTTKRTVPGVSPAVRANVNVSTDAGAVSAAIRSGAGQVAGTLQQAAARDAREEEAAFQRRLRLEEADQKNRDTLGKKDMADARAKLQEEYNNFAETAQPDELEKWWQEKSGSLDAMITADLSEEEAAIQTKKNEGFFSIGETRALGQRVGRNKAAALSVADKNLTESIRNGQDPKTARAEFAKIYNENGKSKEEILLGWTAGQEAGEKLRNKDAVETMRNAASLDPQAVINQMANLKNARDKGEQDTSALKNTDIDSIIRSAEDRQIQLQAKAQAEINAKNTALETELHDAIRAGEESITAVANSGLDAATKRRLEQDLDDENKRDVEKSWAIQDSQDATVGVNEILLSIEGGQVDINEARNTLSQLSRRKTDDGRSIVSKDTFDKTQEKIAKGGRDAVDLFTDEQTAIVSNALVGRLTEQQARNKIRFEAGTMSGTEKRQFSTSGFLLQVAKHQEILYNNGLAQRLRALGIENTSGKEAKAEAVKVWSAIKHKPLETQINDFLVASGQQLENPQGFPQATWDAANARNKATIVNAVSQGFDNKQILEAINQ